MPVGERVRVTQVFDGLHRIDSADPNNPLEASSMPVERPKFLAFFALFHHPGLKKKVRHVKSFIARFSTYAQLVFCPEPKRCAFLET